MACRLTTLSKNTRVCLIGIGETTFAGIETGVYTEKIDIEAVLLVDANNTFNLLNRQMLSKMLGDSVLL